MAYAKSERYDVTSKTILVKLKREERLEYGKLVYSGYIEKFEQETGEPSTIWHPIDDRECRWTIAGRMIRAYYVQSIIGRDDALPAVMVPIPLQIPGTSNGLASWFDHDPCSNYSGDIDRGVAEMRTKLGALFDEYVAGDVERFKSEMNGVTVEVTPAHQPG